MEKILQEIIEERNRQNQLHGDYNKNITAYDSDYIMLIIDQLGSASQVLQYLQRQKMFDETLAKEYKKQLVQVAALVVQVIEKIQLTLS